MLKLSRMRGPLAVLPMLAALASAAPLVRWCALPWCTVTVEDFAACEMGARECDLPCTGPRETMACEQAGGSMACEQAGEPTCGAEPGEPESCAEASAALTCAEGIDASACERDCDAQPATGGRAFCVESPSVATPGRGVPVLDPPQALPAEFAAALLPEPASLAVRPRPADDARPHAPPRSLPPPVRGPPVVA